MATDTIKVHPLLVRITHWVNALAILVMVMSGWKIYNASPIFDFSFPDDLTLGGWLAALMGDYEGARLLHFFCMAGLVLFVVVHVAMVLLVPKTFLTMITGNLKHG